MSKFSKLLAVSLLATAAINTHAEDGKITITGKVVDETCTLTGGTGTDGKTKDITVPLATVKKSAFSTENKTTGTKTFELLLTNSAGNNACDAVTNSGFKGIHITTAATTDYLPHDATTLINKEEEGNKDINPVYIKLLTNDGKAINYTEAWGVQAKSLVENANTQPKLTYQAQYFTETGKVDPQVVSAVVNYTLQYN